jgi:hypothetical protein
MKVEGINPIIGFASAVGRQLGKSLRKHPKKKAGRRITDRERAKGRSENYWQLSPEEQWAQDKNLGILDWEG